MNKSGEQDIQESRYSDPLLVILAVKDYVGLPVLQAEGFARMPGGKRGEDTHIHPAGGGRSSIYPSA
jgi:hypothetical protein